MNMNYEFLKSKPLHERVASHVQRATASDTWNTPAYSASDEERALKMSREDPDHVYFMASVGFSPKSSVFSHLGTINSVSDIATELRDLAKEYHEEVDSEEELPEPLAQFVVNDVVGVSIYQDPDDNSVFVRLEADENDVESDDLSQAKARTNRYLEAHNLHPMNDDKSKIVIGDVEVPYHVYVPSDETLLEILAEDPVEKREFDFYSKLGLCHLYKNGACIARVEFTDKQLIAQNIELSHPHNDKKVFHDISHAVVSSFGISNNLSTKDAAIHNIKPRNHSISDTINQQIMDSDSEPALAALLTSIAERHQLSADHAEMAFWDLYSGRVNGKDLTQYPEMKALYKDIAEQTGQFIPPAAAVADIVLQRIHDFEHDISPNQRMKMSQQSQQAATPKAAHEASSYGLRR